MYGFLKSRFGSGLKDEDKYCLVKTARYCGECVYNNTCTGMRGICRKCGKYRDPVGGVPDMDMLKTCTN